MKIRIKTKLTSAVIISAGFLVEVWAACIFASHYPDYEFSTLLFIIFLHVASSCIAMLGVYFRNDDASRVQLFAFASVLSLPVFGYISVLQFLLSRRTGKSPELYKEYREHITMGATEIQPKTKTFDREEYLRESLKIEPLIDSLRDESDYEKKMGLIKNLSMMSDPNSIKSLKKLLFHRHMDIRYFAGEYIAEVSENYNIFINHLKNEIKNNPDDYNLRFEIGKLYMEYSFSGLFEEESVNKELKNAEIELEKSVEIKPDNFKAHYLLGKVYQHLEDYDKAVKSYENVLKIKPDDFLAHYGLAVCYWRTKDVEKMEEYINLIKPHLDDYNGEDRDDVVRFLELWMGAKEVETA